VLYSSIALAWVLPDEQFAEVDSIAERLERESALVPVIWPLEICNALLMAQRRSRITTKQVSTALEALAGLAIEVDVDASMAAAGRGLALAQSLNLTVYDAMYLELAARRSCALASMDKRLREACRAARISLL
ncbi:MAG: type II toxin-antitoxin system VapC family toxin, partial [Steroidobacteraceae bacterium]